MQLHAIRLLIEAGCDPEVRDNDGYKAEQLPSEESFEEWVALAVTGELL